MKFNGNQLILIFAFALIGTYGDGCSTNDDICVPYVPTAPTQSKPLLHHPDHSVNQVTSSILNSVQCEQGQAEMATSSSIPPKSHNGVFSTQVRCTSGSYSSDYVVHWSMYGNRAGAVVNSNNAACTTPNPSDHCRKVHPETITPIAGTSSTSKHPFQAAADAHEQVNVLMPNSTAYVVFNCFQLGTDVSDHVELQQTFDNAGFSDHVTVVGDVVCGKDPEISSDSGSGRRLSLSSMGSGRRLSSLAERPAFVNLKITFPPKITTGELANIKQIIEKNTIFKLRDASDVKSDSRVTGTQMQIGFDVQMDDGQGLTRELIATIYDAIESVDPSAVPITPWKMFDGPHNECNPRTLKDSPKVSTNPNPSGYDEGMISIYQLEDSKHYKDMASFLFPHCTWGMDFSTTSNMETWELSWVDICGSTFSIDPRINVDKGNRTNDYVSDQRVNIGPLTPQLLKGGECADTTKDVVITLHRCTYYHNQGLAYPKDFDAPLFKGQVMQEPDGTPESSLQTRGWTCKKQKVPFSRKITSLPTLNDHGLAVADKPVIGDIDKVDHRNDVIYNEHSTLTTADIKHKTCPYFIHQVPTIRYDGTEQCPYDASFIFGWEAKSNIHLDLDTNILTALDNEDAFYMVEIHHILVTSAMHYDSDGIQRLHYFDVDRDTTLYSTCKNPVQHHAHGCSLFSGADSKLQAAISPYMVTTNNDAIGVAKVKVTDLKDIDKKKFVFTSMVSEQDVRDAVHLPADSELVYTTLKFELSFVPYGIDSTTSQKVPLEQLKLKQGNGRRLHSIRRLAATAEITLGSTSDSESVTMYKAHKIAQTARVELTKDIGAGDTLFRTVDAEFTKNMLKQDGKELIKLKLADNSYSDAFYTIEVNDAKKVHINDKYYIDVDFDIVYDPKAEEKSKVKSLEKGKDTPVAIKFTKTPAEGDWSVDAEEQTEAFRTVTGEIKPVEVLSKDEANDQFLQIIGVTAGSLAGIVCLGILSGVIYKKVYENSESKYEPVPVLGADYL